MQVVRNQHNNTQNFEYGKAYTREEVLWCSCCTYVGFIRLSFTDLDENKSGTLGK